MTLREEVGRNTYCPKPQLYKQIAEEIFEIALYTWSEGRGVDLEETVSQGRLARWYLHPADRQEIVQNCTALIQRLVTTVIPRTELEHRFCYRILSSGHLLVGLDELDLKEEPKEQELEAFVFDPFEEGP